MMVASRLIENRIEDMEPTKVFTIEDLGFPPEWWENVRVKLSRMVKSGLIAKVGRGKYYKPKASVFGNIGPTPNEVVKDLMYDKGLLTGYITGYTLWNRMGLTSQVSNLIIIGTSRRRDPLRRGNYQVRFIMQPNRITTNSIPLLQILDSLKLIKQIPDTTVGKSITILKRYIVDLGVDKLSMLVKLSMKYPPRVRALLGAILESAGNLNYIVELSKTLNPTTIYSIGLRGLTGFNFTKWNIE